MAKLKAAFYNDKLNALMLQLINHLLWQDVLIQ